MGSSKSEYWIAIDFGNSALRCAIYHNGNIEIIKNKYGKVNTPNILCTYNGRVLLGEEAMEFANIHEAKFYQDYKTSIENTFLNRVDGKPVLSYLFEELKESASLYFCLKKTTKISKAVISVPAFYNEKQRACIREAAEKANLIDVNLIYDTEAIAYAYMSLRLSSKNQRILVYSHGSSGVEASVIEICDKPKILGQPKHSRACNGDDYHNCIIDFIKGIPGVQSEKLTMQDNNRIQMKAQNVKHLLTSGPKVMIELDNITGINIKKTYQRIWFEERNNDKFEAAIKPAADAIETAGLQPTDIDDVIFNGGSTRIPKLQEKLKNCLGNLHFNSSLQADDKVVYGAAIKARYICEHELSRGSIEGLNVKDVDNNVLFKQTSTCCCYWTAKPENPEDKGIPIVGHNNQHIS